MGKLDGRRVAIIATDGFEHSELTSPKSALEGEGARCEVLSLHEGQIRGWKDGDWAGEVKVDHLVAEAISEDFDALLIPGGVMNPDKLRREEDVIRLVQEFFDAGKPIAAICHGPQVLIETGELEGRRLTSFASLKTDLLNAGADWVDQQVVEDDNLITSRTPDDLPAFNAKLIEAFQPQRAPADAYQTLEEQLNALMGTPEVSPMPMPASFSPSPRRKKRKTRPTDVTPGIPNRGRAATAREKPRAKRTRRNTRRGS
ncbi:MAG: type 1 glutamine amidotransferase [Archangiaceae bacterium]|nr:type 1 glutamine amidotransferase [Archangiaceae bacterium]